ncbi:hypothetical protein DFH11DRAFT_1883922 [Phellopilus nigrolimitatus]|nr:hypothetical protein DFH11DRAFT_1883922 [Phellopilus nigrolimitatus]
MSATYDTFGIGGLWAEMAESDSLIKAQTLAAQAQRHLERARGAQPLVNHIPCGKIVEPDWLNIVFDNMYTDFMFQQKIQQSIAAVQRFQEGIFAECAASEERKKSHERDATDARSFLKSRRRALAAVRREILKRVKEDGGVSLHARGDAPQAPAPPLYMPQPEMGTRVLARSQSPLPAGGVTAPVPTMGRQSAPPQYEPSESPALPAPVGMSAQNLPGEILSRETADPVLSRSLSSMRSGTPLRYAPPPGPPPAHNLTSSRVIYEDRRAYTPPSGLPPVPPIISSISNPESKLQRTYTPSPGHSPSLSIYASSPPPLFPESLSTFSRSPSIHMPVAMPEPSFTSRPHSPLPPDMSANVCHTPPASGAEPGKEIGLDQKLSSDASDTDARAAASTSRAPAADAAAGPSPAERSRSGSRSCSPNLASVLDTSDRGQPQLKVFASNNPYRLAS